MWHTSLYVTIYWPFDQDALVARPVHHLCLLHLLFFSAAIPFLYSSSLKGCAIVGVPSWMGGSIGRFGFVGIVPGPLMCNWCATWLTFTRHGGFGVVRSLKSFLIVCHALRLLCVRSVEVMITSSQLVFFFFSSCLSMYFRYQWSFRQKGRLNNVSCMLYIGSLIRLWCQECRLVCILSMPYVTFLRTVHNFHNQQY